LWLHKTVLEGSIIIANLQFCGCCFSWKLGWKYNLLEISIFSLRHQLLIYLSHSFSILPTPRAPKFSSLVSHKHEKGTHCLLYIKVRGTQNILECQLPTFLKAKQVKYKVQKEDHSCSNFRIISNISKGTAQICFGISITL